MLKTKKTKVFIVLLLVISLLFPYATPVALAVDDVKATANETRVIRRAKKYRYKDGEKTYEYYHASKHDVFNIGFFDCEDCEEDEVCEEDELYCVDARTTMTSTQDQIYKCAGDFFNPETEGIGMENDEKKEKSFIGRLVTKDEENAFKKETSNIDADKEREKRYEAIIWLAQNIYIASEENSEDVKSKNDGAKYKDFLNKVFEDYLKLEGNSIENIENNLDKDDVKAISQIAIWYFANKDAKTETTSSSESEKVDPYIHIEKNESVTDNKLFENKSEGSITTAYELKQEEGDDCDIETVEGNSFDLNNGECTKTPFTGTKETLANILLSYYIINAEKAVENNEVKTEAMEFPKIDENLQASAIIDGDNYKIGPFTISDSNIDKDIYNITLKDSNDDVIDASKYTIKEEKENEDSIKIDNLKETVGKTFYIYIPVSNVKEDSDLAKIRLGIQYTESLTEADFWIPKDDSSNSYQPVIEIERTPVTPVVKEVVLDKGDVALRKYITAVNGQKLDVSRVPKVDASGLASGSVDAEYKHKKSPVEVSVGDVITYTLRVYNEGNIDAIITEIKDIIPDGLKLAENDEINKDWTVDENNVAKKNVNFQLTKRNDEEIKKENNKNTETGGLSSESVTIDLVVTDSAKATSILTNVAEISGQNIPDTSTPNSVNKNDVDQSNFSGNNSNKEDLDDSNYYYKGLEDDDDFEKVKIKGKVFDLSLKKFITEKNGEKVEGREPTVDVGPLKNGANDANYTTSKNPVLVEQGDIITYTIRVYNEGDMDGYAEEVADYIPEGLGFLTFYKTNNDNSWSITDAVSAGAKTVKLNTINNATKNLTLSDFENVDSLDDVEVLVGKAKIISTALASGTPVNKSNLIKGFDEKNDNTLAYKDIKVTCVVIDDKLANDNFRNVAEINKHSTPTDDGDTVNPDVTDRDSTPGNVETKPGEDDDDDENLTVEEKVYDLALQKFITKVDETQVTDREPVVTRENDKFTYSHSTTPYPVANGQLVEYTIRVYNEGKTDAYAAEVADNIPNGLQFVQDNETNEQYGWYLVDKNGNRTDDINQAFTVRTDYLSLEKSTERNEDNLLKGYNGESLDSRDLKIVFKVAEDKIDPTVSTDKRVIINVAEITEETDKDGTPVDDEDSVPDNWTDGEDDIDKERVYVKYFDLALRKDLIKVVVSEGGNTTEYNVSEDQLFKVEINKKKLNSTTVKFVYNITVKNEGEIEGYATEVKDYIPEGLEFVAEDNPDWYSLGDGVIGTGALASTLLNPGDSASVKVTLKWINGEGNLGRKINVAEISKDKNPYNTPDIDSTPDNKVPGEDDIDDAPVVLGISTGSSQTYYGLIASIVVIMTTGIILIKKYVL